MDGCVKLNLAVIGSRKEMVDKGSERVHGNETILAIRCPRKVDKNAIIKEANMRLGGAAVSFHDQIASVSRPFMTINIECRDQMGQRGVMGAHNFDRVSVSRKGCQTCAVQFLDKWTNPKSRVQRVLGKGDPGQFPGLSSKSAEFFAQLVHWLFRMARLGVELVSKLEKD